MIQATFLITSVNIDLAWLLLIEDRLRCFGRHNQRQKATFNSSHVGLKNCNVLLQLDPMLMGLCPFEFRTAIYANVWLVKGQKAEIGKLYHGHSMDKTSGGKRLFSSQILDGACNRTLHDCSLCIFTPNVPKKRCGLWLTFFATCPRRPSIYTPS